MLHLHIFIDDSIYGLWRHIVKRKFEFDFEFSLHCPYTSVKGKLFNNDIEVSSRQLKRFNQSVIDPNVYWKLQRGPFVLIATYPFQATLYFHFISSNSMLLFLFEKYGLHAFQNGLEF